MAHESCEVKRPCLGVDLLDICRLSLPRLGEPKLYQCVPDTTLTTHAGVKSVSIGSPRAVGLTCATATLGLVSHRTCALHATLRPDPPVCTRLPGGNGESDQQWRPSPGIVNL